LSIPDEVRAQAILGSDAEAFVDSELGQNILKAANEDKDAAMFAFMNADVTDVKAMTAIQIDLKVAVRFEQYMYKIIMQGREMYEAATKSSD
jgi:hypothetical protein